MIYNFCPICGEPLEQKEIGDEGMLPFCPSCNKPYFEVINPCVLIAVINEHNEIALLKQDFQTAVAWALVAGYMKKGESAEEAATREVEEESGQRVDELIYMGSFPFKERDQLMLCYMARVKKQAFAQSKEILGAGWFSLKDAVATLLEGSIGQKLTQLIQAKISS